MNSGKAKLTANWTRRLKPLFRVINGLLQQPEPVRIRVQYRRFK
jgi:hypothetical protein